ncbi:PH domain-containing protein [Periweissella fabalis]|uniref:PH domain-containing protein n=1 Tax=Periweissella fabalis TaxID=1070421 RepID=A0A7X6N5T7_9LACO|nr:PH domain-containing protein [Periweissella fabalis]MCM0598843.1 PH domain-containing protein [Periweissella fabalis]NKZ24505.1 PH domain-containing protein [Periweissella fabalis]
MPKRLHWLLVPITVINSLINSVFIFVILIFIASTFNLPKPILFGLCIILALLIIALPIINYFKTTYALEAQEFSFKTGVIIKQARHMPYTRIQSIERIQPWYMQIFKLVELKIETASQDDEPIVLKALTIAAADEIEATRNQRQHSPIPGQVEVLYPQTTGSDTHEAMVKQPTTPNPKNDISYAINMHELMIYGLTSLGILPGISILFLLYSHLSEIIPKHFLNQVNQLVVKNSVIAIVALTILAIIFGMFLSLLQILNRYYHQVVTRNNNTFSISKGFFSKTTVHFDQRKIQGITIEQSFLRRLFKLYTVKLFISGSDKQEDANDKSLVLIPVIDQLNLPVVLKNLLPEYEFEFNQLGRDNAKSHFWNFWRIGWLWFCWLPLVLIPIYYGWYIPVIIIGIIIIITCITVWAWLDNTETKYAIFADQLNIQNNVFMTKKIFLLRANKLQLINHHQSIFMVHGNTHHLDFVIREGSHAASLTLRYLEANENEKLQTWYSQQVLSENK